MNKYFSILIVLLGFCQLKAQYGNEWIDFNQTYFAFDILEDGIHRIPYQTLVDAGIDVSNIEPNNFQVFGRGEEIALYVEGDDDGSFDDGDFIEFYAQRNDGYFDAQMYASADEMVNPYYSLFNDTIHYFLTWNASSNLRVTEEAFTNTSGLTPVDYVWDEYIHYYSVFYHRGLPAILNLERPDYLLGEGFVSHRYGKGQLVSEAFSLNVNTSAGVEANIKATYIGMSDDDSYLEDHFNEVTINGNTVDNIVTSGREMYTLNEDIPLNYLTSSNTLSFQSDPNSLPTNDYWALGYWKVEYPMNASFNFTKKLFEMEDNPNTSNSFLKFFDFTGTNNDLVVYDVSNNKKISAFNNNSTPSVIIGNSGGRKSIWMQTISTINTINELEEITFVNYENLDNDYIVLTHPALMDGALNYANYRNNTGYNTIVVDVNQLFYQFGHGIKRHPEAIRKFLDYSVNNWEEAPRYLFIIGDGIQESEEVNSWAGTIRRNGHANEFVPTYGAPGSDILFSSGLGDAEGYAPKIATGRLAVTTNEDVNAYLAKVVEHENAGRDEWMKRIIHFSGGGDDSESSTYYNYLQQQEAIIVDSLFGGEVYRYKKFDTSPLAVAMSDSLTHFIEEGTRILNVFSHASLTNFEYFIQEPQNYNNQGKYYFVIAVSCQIGNVFNRNGDSGSEKYVKPANRGAIGFLSTSSSGVPSYGNTFSKAFYRQIGVSNYNGSIGESIKYAISEIQTTNDLMNLTCLTMILNGDPALALSNFDKPDFSIYKDETLVSADIFTTPSIVTTEVDSFDLNLVVRNIGMSRDTAFWVNVTRDFPNELKQDTIYSVFVDHVYNKDTLTLRLPVDFINGIGLNNFHVQIDLLNDVEELDDIANNNANFELFIRSADLIPVYPYDFAVIPDSVPDLIAVTGDLFATEKTYVFEIDTSDSFSSPVKLAGQIISSGGVVKWKPQEDPNLMSFFVSNYSDSIVYFWRTSVDSSSNNGEYNWRNSSFQFISGKEGWGQAHFHQRKNNEYKFMNYFYNSWTYSFVTTPLDFMIYIGWNVPNFERGYYINNAVVNSGILGGSPNGWVMGGAINNETLEPVLAESMDVGQFNSTSNGNIWPNVSDKIFKFKANDPTYISNFHDLMINQFPDSFYVFAYSFKRNWSSYWDDYGITEDMMGDFSDIGMDTSFLKNSTNINIPWGFFVKKGDLSTAQFFGTDVPYDTVLINAELAKSWTDGAITSPLIGPSTSWGSWHWKSSMMESINPNETFRLELWGVTLSGQETLLIDSMAFDEDIVDLENHVDASIYPYVKLKAYTEDVDFSTPTFLDSWHVLFDEIPEAALNPNIEMNLPSENVQEGLDYTFSYSVENISNVDMDSLLVAYWIIDKDNNIHPIKYKVLDSLHAGEYITDSISINTLNISGVNQIWLEINPYEGIRPWQVEKYHFNNLANWTFEVDRDKINPVLDVTFDGVHILDGDIVAPQPRIVVQLQDENEFLALDDTSLFEVYIDYPHILSLTPNRVYFSTSANPENIKFYPATLPDNKARFEFLGDFPVDGTHMLYVRAHDKSSNISGDGDGVYDYKINFEVVNESSITSVMNYPNPFSTSTRFVFTLTGSKIPTEFKIQIMTITGKVVKEITREEIGDIHIGRNITDYAWDGKDQYGQQLANGVYLYRVITNIDGEEIELYETNADQFFTKGFGKLYLMR